MLVNIYSPIYDSTACCLSLSFCALCDLGSIVEKWKRGWKKKWVLERLKSLVYLKTWFRIHKLFFPRNDKISRSVSRRVQTWRTSSAHLSSPSTSHHKESSRHDRFIYLRRYILREIRFGEKRANSQEEKEGHTPNGAIDARRAPARRKGKEALRCARSAPLASDLSQAA